MIFRLDGELSWDNVWVLYHTFSFHTHELPAHMGGSLRVRIGGGADFPFCFHPVRRLRFKVTPELRLAISL